jgi:hypothetical protein
MMATGLITIGQNHIEGQDVGIVTRGGKQFPKCEDAGLFMLLWYLLEGQDVTLDRQNGWDYSWRACDTQHK